MNHCNIKINNYEIQYSENSINSSKFIEVFLEMSCTQYDTNYMTLAKVWGNQVVGDKKVN